MEKSPRSFLKGIVESMQNVIYEKEGIKKYRAILEHFLKDGAIDNEELEQLQFIEKQYGLKKSESQKIQKIALTQFYDKIKSDKKISQSERETIEQLMKVFSLLKEDIHFDQYEFNKYYALGLIEEGLLPEVLNAHELNIQFNKDEKLHCATASALCKIKKITEHINYKGLTASIRICKGLHYRIGQVGVKTKTKEILDVEDAGFFYITNCRIGFKGKRKQFSIAFNKIVSFELTDYGMFIFKSGKESPYILTIDDYEVPLAMVSYILNSQ